MKAIITHQKKEYHINLNKPISLAIAIQSDNSGVTAWYLPHSKIEPVVIENWVGSVAKGAPVNFNNIYFNPHSHCTHTESLGHITKDFYSVNKLLKKHFFVAEVITVAPEKLEDDFVISKKQIAFALKNTPSEAVIIRTIPNLKEKKGMQYTDSNPPYLLAEAATFLRENGVKHLLVDLPSLDKEVDGGKLLAHNAFWNTENKPRKKATITELIYVPNKVADGTYILNLQVAPFENDAAPSKPVLYKIIA